MKYSLMVDQTHHLTVDIEPVNTQPLTPRAKIQATGSNRAPSPLQAPMPQDLDPQLNRNYSFENFIEGVSNKLPRSVGQAIAEHPKQSTFNPLFIYGASGVGKTHLVNAIGAKIKELHPTKRVLYVSAHLFQVQYTDSVRKNTVNDFINFYQTIDVLIIDDVQEFASLTKTQNTFFHIFNHLHQNGRQLILTSDRPPTALQGMEERLLTRFKWGLLAELEKPNQQLRHDILENKIRQDGLKIPEEVIDFVSENVNDSVRELEGIVNSLMAYSVVEQTGDHRFHTRQSVWVLQCQARGRVHQMPQTTRSAGTANSHVLGPKTYQSVISPYRFADWKTHTRHGIAFL